MSLAPDRTTTTFALIGLSIAVTLAGCTRDRTPRPFADVTDAERNESTLAAEPVEPVEPVETVETVETAATQEAAAPVVAEATVASQPRLDPIRDETPAPPSEQPAVVPPTETIRAETPTAAGPATTSAAAGPGRYHIVAEAPAIIPTTRPAGAPVATGAEIPIVIDEVGLVRQWPLWIGERPSGNVVAGPYYWPTISREPRRREINQGFIEPVEFLWNTLLLPYRMVRTPPWTAVTYDPAREQDEPRVPYEVDDAEHAQQ